MWFWELRKSISRQKALQTVFLLETRVTIESIIFENLNHAKGVIVSINNKLDFHQKQTLKSKSHKNSRIMSNWK